MKVTTESCLFGAYIARRMNDQGQSEPKTLLDIGSGTGLLSLMIVQKNPYLLIDGVEIEKDAAEQCQENFDTSPWKDKLSILHSSIQEYEIKTKKKYDFIVSNPPFYQDQLETINPTRLIAHHSLELTFEELFRSVHKLLKSDGEFFILVPNYRRKECIDLGEKYNLYPKMEINFSQSPKHEAFRSILILSPMISDLVLKETLSIRDGKNEYSTRFNDLLEDYYL